MKFFHSGTSATFIAATSPPLISRRLASPDADTMSYWLPPPWRISVTISSEEPAYLACTWHPVEASNGFTHAGSAYPSHATRFNWPSPAPIAVGRLEVLLDELPQAAAPSTMAARTTPSATSILLRLMCCFPPLCCHRAPPRPRPARRA